MNEIVSATIDAFGRQATVSVWVADALDTPVDGLALKYAQAEFGVDKEALRRVRAEGLHPHLPESGQVQFIPSPQTIAALQIVLVGTVPLQFFEYAEIREFSRLAIGATQHSPSPIKTLGMTLHGVGVGLDEIEAFTAQLAGVLDALRRGEWGEQLIEVKVLELDPKRAKRIAATLQNVLPRKIEEQSSRTIRSVDRATGIDSAGIESRTKRHIFVAMQFGADTDDLFHYGIEKPVRDSGFLCERIDSVSFTGDILTKIKSRIDTATLVVAEVSNANPNVYLEIGYAWGRNVPTLLLARDASALRFDIRGQRCLIHSSIHDLETKLAHELGLLAPPAL